MVSPKNTNNIKIAELNSIKTILGYEISLEQAIIQFKLYVNKKISSRFVKIILNKALVD